MDGNYEITETMLKVAMMPQLSDREKALRDVFVQEYLKDFDRINAALRCGFMRSFADEYSAKFMDEPYVQQRIAAMQNLIVDDSSGDAFASTRQRIISALMREAHYTGKGSTQAARVAALSKLASIYGLDKGGVAPVDNDPTSANQRGGVMRVPEIADVTAWEEVAIKTQQKLVTDVRS